MMALARVAFALAASLVGAADVVTYDNATKEVATMEAFYDAVLAAGGKSEGSVAAALPWKSSHERLSGAPMRAPEC